jgi:pyridoxal 5'-phosphate synthase pdxS subunit
MALERIPADIRKDGGVARMSDPKMIKEIKAAVSIPVMAKCRIGHFVEAQILEAIGIDYIDESEVSLHSICLTANRLDQGIYR